MANTPVTKADVSEATLNIANNIEAAKKSVITPLDVRLGLMDYVDVNIPLYKEHLTDEQLWKCIEWGCETFNELQPQLKKTYTTENFPKPKLLLDLALIEALKLTSLIELRGEMQYSDGGVQSSVYYKSAQFATIRQELQQSTEQHAISLKRSMNVNDCYGHLC